MLLHVKSIQFYRPSPSKQNHEVDVFETRAIMALDLKLSALKVGSHDWHT